jgi:hypothetical protein
MRSTIVTMDRRVRTRSLGVLLGIATVLCTGIPSWAAAPGIATPSPDPSTASAPTWKALETPSLVGFAGLERAVSDEGQVIAVGVSCSTEDVCSHEIVASSDGQAWARRGTLPAEVARVGDIVADGEALIVVGQSEQIRPGEQGPSIWRSVDDGATWQAVGDPSAFEPDADGRASRSPSGNPYELSIQAVARGPGGLAAVGWLDSEDLDRSAVWLSKDGTDWARIRLPRAMDRGGGLIDVAATDKAYVVVGADGLWRSSDGRHWQPAPLGTEEQSGTARDVESTDSGFMALGGAWPRPAVWTASPDGRTWALLPEDPGLADIWDASLHTFGSLALAIGATSADPSVASVWRREADSDWAQEAVASAADASLSDGVTLDGRPLLVGTVASPDGSRTAAVWHRNDS